MADRDLERVLAKCLEDIELGHASPEECLKRYPQHAVALSGYLGMQDRLAALRPSASLLGSERGERRLLAAVATTPFGVGGMHVIPQFLAMVPKAVLSTVAAVAVTGGAMGASAAAGGPNIPAQALSAVGIHLTQTEEATVSLTATATVTSTATASATAAANDSSEAALCMALTNGSERGQEAKAKAEAFARLARGAEAEGKTVEQLCATLPAPGKSPTSTATATVTATASAQGASESAPGRDRGEHESSSTATLGVTATVGIGNASGSAQTGIDHADPRAADGRGNSER